MKSSLVAAGLVLSTLVACGGSASIPDVCAKLAACETQGGTQAECEQSLEEDRSAADAAGCTGEFDDYVSCVDGLSDVCNQQDLQTECADEVFSYFVCAGSAEPQPG
jgi:hypothetical protein